MVCNNDTILYRVVQDPVKGELRQLVLPQSLKAKVLESVHDHPGHQGIERTLNLVRKRCYWPKIHTDVEDWCKKCKRCVLAITSQLKVNTTMGSFLATKPLEVLAIDFIILEKARDGRENVLVLTDVFTKMAHAVPTRYKKQILWRKHCPESGFSCVVFQSASILIRVETLSFTSTQLIQTHFQLQY